MKTRHILTALATASLIVGGQALAQGRGGGHGGGAGGGHGGGMGGGIGVGLGGNAGGGLDLDRGRSGLEVNTGIETRLEARRNSQGPLNASERARLRANENSVLKTNPATLPDLGGLRTGMTVVNSSDVTVGTVERIVRSSDGRIRSVIVTGADGQQRRIRLSPNSLTINGEVVTTTALRLND